MRKKKLAQPIRFLHRGKTQEQTSVSNWSSACPSLPRLSGDGGEGAEDDADGPPPSLVSPWLSRAGLRPGALPPSLRLPGPPPETRPSLKGGLCRTQLSPESRGDQLKASTTSSGSWDGMEVLPGVKVGRPVG